MFPSRRALLKSAGLFACAVAASPLGAKAAHARTAAPRADLGIAAGMRFGASQVERVGDPEFGAVPIRLVDPDGRGFRVDVLRHDPEAPGVARGGSLSVYVVNSGGGARTTEEEHGLAAIAIAAHLAAREAAGAAVPRLLTLTERAARREKLLARA
jgi:hypothetical protein